jgi:succinate dehydrogenase / fumarate reductase cytochrome b subunit
MSLKNNILNSTVANKFVMAITGVILIGFIAGHAAGNLQIFLGRDVYNAYSEFLHHGLGEALWAIRAILGVSLIMHVFTSIRLKLINNAAKPQKYKVSNYIKSTLYSRSMIWTGIMMAGFVIFHLLHYKTGHVIDAHRMENFGIGGMEIRQDVYYKVITGFSNLWLSCVYIVSVILLGFHLAHSIQSMFQSLGLTFGKYSDKSMIWSRTIAILITIAFASVPLGVMFGILG